MRADLPLVDKKKRISNTNSHPAKLDIDKKLLPKQKTIQNFNIDAPWFRKARNENPPILEIGVTS